MPFPMIVLIAGSLALAQPGASPASTTAAPPAAGPASAQASGPFRVVKSFDVGGEGGWDLLAVDGTAHRLYVPRGDRVMVIDTQSGKLVGEIAGTEGVHGVAIVPALGKGFTSNGKSGTVTVFDLKTLKAVQTVKAGTGPDAILYEPVIGCVVVFNGKSNDATVINAADGAVLGSIAVGGKPELAIADGTGKVWVNVEDTSEIIRLDIKTRTVEKRTPLSPGEAPTGLAFDAAKKHLFAACGNGKMVVVDAQTGKVLATPEIGSGVDGAGFDAAGGFALSSNGEGTLSVVSTKDDRFDVVQTLKTATRARTMAFDPISRMIYLPTAEFEASPPAPAGGGDAGKKKAPRPAMKAGSFRILVVGPEKTGG